MPKYYDEIGFATTVEDPVDSGISVDKIVKKKYGGDVLNATRRIEVGDTVNPDLNVSNRISTVANEYAMQNFHSIRYAKYLGVRWRVNSVEVQTPRLILSLGGLYNGED
jgi:hypothetical protein